MKKVTEPDFWKKTFLPRFWPKSAQNGHFWAIFGLWQKWNHKFFLISCIMLGNNIVKQMQKTVCAEKFFPWYISVQRGTGTLDQKVLPVQLRIWISLHIKRLISVNLFYDQRLTLVCRHVDMYLISCINIVCMYGMCLLSMWTIIKY